MTTNDRSTLLIETWWVPLVIAPHVSDAADDNVDGDVDVVVSNVVPVRDEVDVSCPTVITGVLADVDVVATTATAGMGGLRSVVVADETADALRPEVDARMTLMSKPLRTSPPAVIVAEPCLAVSR